MGDRFDLIRLFLHEKEHPEPFYERLADRTVAHLPYGLRGVRVLDLGAGPGYYSAALARDGAAVVGVDLDATDLVAASRSGRLRAAIRADGGRLPFPDGAFAGVMCSNVLEHTPAPGRVLDEIERVLQPGGWAWVSWTNWYSPWGGHEIVPLHYLGPRLGLATWRRLRGEPRKNVPFAGLWPTYIGRTLRDVRARAALRLVDAVPRYYPSQRWILRVPGLREVATWNCLLRLEKVGPAPSARPGQARRARVA